MITVTAFRWAPPFAQGLVRDLRVRWALEEAGLPYEERLVGSEETKTPEYRAHQPFGQVPVFEEDGRSLFESGAIVHYLSERSTALAPADPAERAQVTMWIFAALNSIEQYVGNLTDIDLFSKGEAWTIERRPQVVETVVSRLGKLAVHMGQSQFLVGGRFTAADIIMTTVLRDVPPDIMERFPTLLAYRTRCEDRPAFKKALADQIAPFERNAPRPG
jgi:glutathione S-transferase